MLLLSIILLKVSLLFESFLRMKVTSSVIAWLYVAVWS